MMMPRPRLLRATVLLGMLGMAAAVSSSDAPTMEPSASASPSHSSMPTMEPSASGATEPPSLLPTWSPTAALPEPSAAPTEASSRSDEPTESGSGAPSLSWSNEPSESGSWYPTEQGSAMPSWVPTMEPTEDLFDDDEGDTPAPTRSPTPQPTRDGDVQVTVPTAQPTMPPTAFPTVSPSGGVSQYKVSGILENLEFGAAVSDSSELIAIFKAGLDEAVCDAAELVFEGTCLADVVSSLTVFVSAQRRRLAPLRYVYEIFFSPGDAARAGYTAPSGADTFATTVATTVNNVFESSTGIAAFFAIVEAGVVERINEEGGSVDGFNATEVSASVDSAEAVVVVAESAVGVEVTNAPTPAPVGGGPPPSDDGGEDGLGLGAIIGIVVGALVLVALIVAVVVIASKDRERKAPIVPAGSQGPPAAARAPAGAEQQRAAPGAHHVTQVTPV